MILRRPLRYAPVQKWLHWGMALLIVIMVAVGVTMTRMAEGGLTDVLYELHKSFGLIVLALAVLRLCVRLALGAPEPVQAIPRWQRAAARFSHRALYALLVLVPLIGWIATSSCCAPVKLFWSIPLTVSVPTNEIFSKAAFWLHIALVVSLVCVVAVHVMAALQHHFIRRDETLRRMLPEKTRGQHK